MRRSWIIAVAVLIGLPGLLATCGGRGGERDRPPQPPTADQLAYATYTGIYEEAITLNAGLYEGEPFVEGGASRPRVALLKDLRLTGDLDGDGAEEALALLSENSGGNGERLYLAAMKREPGRAVNIGTALVGDRVKVRSMSFVEGRVRLEVLQAGDGDAMSSPRELATREWELRDGTLEEVSSEVTGRL